MSLGLIINVDMDGVIASWGDEFDRELDSYGEAAANIPRHMDPRNDNWDLKAGRTEDEKRIITEIMRRPRFYAKLKPVPGAREALKALLEQGHDVRIVTAPYITNPTCASDKLNWVLRHLGSGWASRVVMTTDKTVVRGDILIDDKPTVVGSRAPEWQHVLFGEYPYNIHARGPRLRTWQPADVALTIWEAVVGR